uniref:Uncharacterized protein n=1 Tax=Globisporangium ultimum (strain ATCC 200006 / CBS 805.95 / DAOM BR144) TaxID=431595 RepID=K3WNJ3_GLOUD
MNESQVMERSSTPHTSTTEAPPADPVPQVTVAKRDSKNDSSAKERKAGRKGLLSRKRLVLKIDPELTKESEGRAGQVASSSEGAGSDPDKSTLVGGGDATTPWWILEYRCPPPGHLGAHDVSVAVREQEQEQEEKQNERSSNMRTVTEGSMER